MTPAEAYDATRDALASTLHAHAQADGIKLSIGQIYGLLDTALERSGFRALVGAAQAADVAAGAYAGTYETVPPAVAGADADWRALRSGLDDFPNLSGVLTA